MLMLAIKLWPVFHNGTDVLTLPTDLKIEFTGMYELKYVCA